MSDSSSSSTFIVAIVAIIVIVALGFLLYRQMPSGASNTQPGTNVDIQLPGGSTPSSTGY